MFSIEFNGCDSKELELFIEHRPCVPIPNRDINEIYIKGRGTLIEDLGSYGDIQINITFSFKDRYYYDKISKVKNWLCSIRDHKLIFSDNNDMYYKVKKVQCENIGRSLKVLGRFTVNFICEPFLYYLNNEEIVLTSDDTFESPEFAYKSEPIITIYGSGDITLYVNSNSIELENLKEYVILDSTLKECYKDDENMNSNMYGDFPSLIQGENSISFKGNINKLKIKTNWRCL